jgi:hypothetical protein
MMSFSVALMRSEGLKWLLRRLVRVAGPQG